MIYTKTSKSNIGYPISRALNSMPKNHSGTAEFYKNQCAKQSSIPQPANVESFEFAVNSS